MPAPYPKEFREDVVRVARNREPGQKLSVIAKDFGISESCLTNWMRQADVEDGNRPGKTREDSTELRELRRRNRLLEQENEVGAYPRFVDTGVVYAASASLAV